MKKEHGDTPVQVYGRLEDLPKGSLPEVAVSGRSNVGKSSLLNTLLGRRVARTSNTPGKTQTINLYRTADVFLIADLPGYGYARLSRQKREAWGHLIEGYLAGRETLRGALLLIDGRHPPTPLDIQMKRWLVYHGIRVLYVATKADQIPRGKRIQTTQTIRKGLELEPSTGIHLFSSRTGEGKEALWRAILGLAGAMPGESELKTETVRKDRK